MMRSAALFLLIGSALLAHAQYPNTRTLEVRTGEQRPRITCMAQDAQGLLWVGSDLGVIRTDGLRQDLVLRTETTVVTAIAAGQRAVYAALSDGTVLRCRGLQVDTLLRDTTLTETPVRLLLEKGGDLLLGTYGAGCRWWSGEHSGTGRMMAHIDAARGMPDDHVNAMCLLGDGRVAVATDQGIAIIWEQGVVQVLDQKDGVPDNLVLSLALDEHGRLWAGTDQSGVFRVKLRPEEQHVVEAVPPWAQGPVRSLTFSRGMMWIGTEGHGVLVHDMQGGARYTPQDGDSSSRATDLLAAKDGAVWWCDGSDVLRRSDPDVLVMPEHEGIDLRKVSALCADPEGHIWFALGDRVFGHECGFGDADSLNAFRLPLVGATISALHTDAHGTVWAGTMGEGVFAIHPATRRIEHWTERDGLLNDHVLAIAHDASGILLGTLAGIGRIDGDGHPSARTGLAPGFIYDALVDADGTAWFATDGDGVLQAPPGQAFNSITDTALALRTFYSLSLDDNGRVWASGPGTGFCLIGPKALDAFAIGVPPMDGEVFGIESYQGHILAFGDRGVCAFDPRTRKPVDIGADVGLRGIQMPLNATCSDTTGALWIACDRGLVRLRPSAQVLDARVPVTITDLRWGDVSLPLRDGLRLRADQNFLTFHFAGLRYGAPDELRFQVRLVGFDNGIKETRDRDASWSRLPPGDYRMEVRAFLGTVRSDDPWTTMSFTIPAPWYRRGWAIALAAVLAAAVLFAFLRLRDLRVRERERMEKERVRFQLEAVRSQVNPHFLFNSFNTLIELIEDDPGKAVEHTQQLSDFFRDILQVREKDVIPLSEELVLLDNYFALEKRRFGDRIFMEKRIDERMLSFTLPPLTLQLLVENAIKHNAALVGDPLVVEVVATEGRITVRNPFRPRASSSRSTGFGLDSIRQRYAALSAGPVEVLNSEGVFEVRIPLIAPEP